MKTNYFIFSSNVFPIERNALQLYKLCVIIYNIKPLDLASLVLNLHPSYLVRAPIQK